MTKEVFEQIAEGLLEAIAKSQRGDGMTFVALGSSPDHLRERFPDAKIITEREFYAPRQAN